MVDTIDERRIHGEWMRSDEEETDESLVFRRAEYDFPRRRMPRERLAIEPGGSIETGVAGRADRTIRAAGTWVLDGDQLTISDAGGLSGRYRVISVDEHRLVVRRYP